MGTHPIFESDFDCLTDSNEIPLNCEEIEFSVQMTIEVDNETEKNRQKVVRNYRQGHPGESDEEESLEELGERECDQFGFYRSVRFIKLQNQKLASNRRRDKRRVKKWAKMESDFERARSRKLRSRVYKGVSIEARKSLWLYLLQPNEMRAQYDDRVTFDQLVQLGERNGQCVNQIHLDIRRTWRMHRDFRQQYQNHQTGLFRILVAYAAFDPDVEYCQGMSGIGALLLIILDSVELTFWCLCSLLNRPQYRHRGMFLPGFPKLAEFTKHWETIFEMALPKLSRHFEVENVFSQMYLTKWFLQTFLDRLPFHLCIRLWDVYLLEGDLVVLATTLTLFKAKQQSMLRMDFETLTMFLQNDLCNISTTDDQFFVNIQKDLQWLKNSNLIATRESSYASAPAVPVMRPSSSSTQKTPKNAISKSKTHELPSMGPIPNKASDASTSSYDNVPKSPSRSLSSRSRHQRPIKSPKSPPPMKSAQLVQPQSPPKVSSPAVTRRTEVRPPQSPSLKNDASFKPVTEWARKYSRHRELQTQ